MKSHEHYERRRIETPRLWLRPMREDDARLIVDWRNEPSTAAMFFSEPPSLREHLEWFHGPRVGRVDYVVVRRNLDRPIGVVNFKSIDEDRRTAEGGKMIGDLASRGLGMAKEAYAAWLLYGFGTLGLKSVMVRTREDNTANIALNRKLGFETGERFCQQAADGEEHVFVTMSIDREVVEDHDYYRRIDRQAYFESPPGPARGRNA